MSNYLGGILDAKINFGKDLILDADFIEYSKNAFFKFGTINVTERYYDLSQYHDLSSAEFIKRYIKEYKIKDI
jgi:hypothetical protein